MQPSDREVADAQRLLSTFHHEAGTPVSLIASALRHLRRSERLDDENGDLVETALRQVDVLERLLDDVRRADEERLHLEVESVDLVELATELVADLGTTVLEAHPCAVHAPGGPVPADVDPARVRQLLSNLLDNAAQFSDAGKQVEVEVRREGDHAVIWVTDQGSGIADPDLERIFARYERVSEEHEGLGLGLYVVWRIVTAHGGEVEAVPAPDGPGARFVVRLPTRH